MKETKNIIICPYCGHKHNGVKQLDLYGVNIHDKCKGFVCECDGCERDFKVTFEIMIAYSTKKKQGDDKMQGLTHLKSYIGCKIIKAEPMGSSDFFVSDETDRPGYKVRYPDGYVSWSPKDVFESAYREISDSERALIED